MTCGRSSGRYRRQRLLHVAFDDETAAVERLIAINAMTSVMAVALPIFINDEQVCLAA